MCPLGSSPLGFLNSGEEEQERMVSSMEKGTSQVSPGKGRRGPFREPSFGFDCSLFSIGREDISCILKLLELKKDQPLFSRSFCGTNIPMKHASTAESVVACCQLGKYVGMSSPLGPWGGGSLRA